MRFLPRKHILVFDWLVHLLAAVSVYFPVAVWLSSDSSAWQVLLVWPLYLLMWYRGFWQSGRALFAHLLLACLLNSWAMTLHWSGVFLYLSAITPLFQLRQLKQVFGLSAVMSGWLVMLGLWLEYNPVLIISLGVMMTLGSVIDYWFFRLIHSQRDLLRQQDDIEYLTRERERERIARDLHDVLGHTLSSIALKADLAEKLLLAQQSERAQREITDIAATARQALAEVRQTVTGYRAGNFRSEITMISHSLASAGIELQLPSVLPDRLGRETENMLSLIVRESVTNVIRHAQATQVQIRLFLKNRSWHLRIKDNGRGWSGQFGNGLTGMQERLQAQGGRLKLEAQPDGTLVHAILPVDSAEEEHAN